MEEEIKGRIRDALEGIPGGHLIDPVIKETIRCVLFGFLREQGLQPVPAFKNPRFPEGPVDIVGMADQHTVSAAFCSGPTVELDHVKSLERVIAEKKYVITFSRNAKKVKMSTFFLKPGIEHITLYDEEPG